MILIVTATTKILPFVANKRSWRERWSSYVDVVIFQVAKVSCRLIKPSENKNSCNTHQQRTIMSYSNSIEETIVVSDLDVLCKCHGHWLLFVPWWVYSLTICFVLHYAVGRGETINNHPGNQFLSQEKKGLQEEYLAAKRSVKHAIAQRLVNSIHARGGRFLKKKDGKWQTVKDKQALEKCAQAMRTVELSSQELSARRIYYNTKRAIDNREKTLDDLTEEEIASRELYKSVCQRVREEKKSKKRNQNNIICCPPESTSSTCPKRPRLVSDVSENEPRALLVRNTTSERFMDSLLEDPTFHEALAVLSEDLGPAKHASGTNAERVFESSMDRHQQFVQWSRSGQENDDLPFQIQNVDEHLDRSQLIAMNSFGFSSSLSEGAFSRRSLCSNKKHQQLCLQI